MTNASNATSYNNVKNNNTNDANTNNSCCTHGAGTGLPLQVICIHVLLCYTCAALVLLLLCVACLFLAVYGYLMYTCRRLFYVLLCFTGLPPPNAAGRT